MPGVSSAKVIGVYGSAAFGTGTVLPSGCPWNMNHQKTINKEVTLFPTTRKILVLILMVSLCLSFTRSFSQANITQIQIDKNIKKRWDLDLLKSKYPKKAPQIIKIIQDNFPDEKDSLIVRGDEKMIREDWTGAKFWYEISLLADPDHLLANYLYGICEREIGRRRILFMKTRAWKKAQECFEHVIDEDSTFEDVFFQYALLERYRKHCFKALNLAQRQLAIEYDANTQMGILNLYDFMLNNEKNEEAEAWLKSQNTKYDDYYLGELYRRTNQFEKADSIFQTILTDPGDLPVTPIFFSLVRYYVLQDEPEKAEATFWLAVNSISNELEARLLLEDFMPIVNEKEYQLLVYELPLNSISEALRVYWLERDPLPASSYNRRLIEHYRRLMYAEEHYRYDGYRPPMAKADVLNGFSFPDWYHENQKFDDRGLIYIRYGNPDDWAMAVTQDLPPNISWLYEARGEIPKLIFHFCIPSQAPLGYWSLSPTLADSLVVQDMLTWDTKYQRLYSFTLSEGERWAILEEIVAERVQMVKDGFRHDRHTWPEKTRVLDMPHVASQFRKSDEEELLQLAYSIPFESIINDKTEKDSIKVEAGIAVFDCHMLLIHKDIRRYVVTDHSDPHVWNDLFIDEFEISLVPERYNISLHARILSTNHLNGWRFKYPIDGDNRDRLACSTLKLAFHVAPEEGKDSRHRDDLKIIPNPTKKFNKNEPIYSYYEIYNLTYNAQGKTDFTVNFILKQSGEKGNILRNITGIFSSGQKYQISIQSDQTGDSRTVTDYISFDVSRGEKGEYELILEVKDNVTGDVASKVAELILN